MSLCLNFSRSVVLTRRLYMGRSLIQGFLQNIYWIKFRNDGGVGELSSVVPHKNHVFSRSQSTAVSIPTAYGLDGLGFGVRVPIGLRIFTFLSRSDRPYGPPNTMRYQSVFGTCLLDEGKKKLALCFVIIDGTCRGAWKCLNEVGSYVWESLPVIFYADPIVRLWRPYRSCVHVFLLGLRGGARTTCLGSAIKAFPSVATIIKKNSMVWVHERTISTERPPLVGEVIAKFCG
jgi:hypothetical protein